MWDWKGEKIKLDLFVFELLELKSLWRLWGTVNKKGCWDSGSLRHPLLMFIHAPSRGSRFYNCLLLCCWGACAHINVVVVHWNNKENRNVEMHIGTTAGCACTMTASLILQGDCLFARSVGACSAVRECQELPASDSCFTRSVSAYKPSALVLHYQVLWRQGAWQNYKAQVRAKC